MPPHFCQGDFPSDIMSKIGSFLSEIGRYHVCGFYGEMSKIVHVNILSGTILYTICSFTNTMFCTCPDIVR